MVAVAHISTVHQPTLSKLRMHLSFSLSVSLHWICVALNMIHIRMCNIKLVSNPTTCDGWIYSFITELGARQARLRFILFIIYKFIRLKRLSWINSSCRFIVRKVNIKLCSLIITIMRIKCARCARVYYHRCRIHMYYLRRRTCLILQYSRW